MATQELDSLAIPPPNLQLADWVRRRRRAMGLTQEAAVQRMRDTGVVMSRGHLSHCEMGTYAFRPEHVVALDAALEASGDLIALAEQMWGRSIGTITPGNWVLHGQRLHELIRDERAAPPRHGIEEIARWWETRAGDESIVVKGREQVQAAMLALLTLAAQEPFPAARPPIELSGAFEGLRSMARPGLPKNVRRAIRSLMERGWPCRHHIPTPLDDPDETSLVYIAAPLIACNKFDARIIDPIASAAVENMLVIPDLAAVQFYATGSARHIDAAVIHKRADARRVLEERMRQLGQISRKFVTRYERQPQHGWQLTRQELAFRQLLADVSTIQGPSHFLVGCFPTATNPPGVYEDRLARRRAKARGASALDLETWREMVRTQRQRHDALIAQLDAKQHQCQIIVTPDQVELPSEDTDHWKVEERREHLRYVLELMKYPTFEVGIAKAKLSKGIEACKWEVREGASRRVVIVQSNYTPVNDASTSRRYDMLPVDLRIDTPGAVRAFAAYYRHLWDTVVHHDQADIKRRLQEAIGGGGSTSAENNDDSQSSRVPSEH